MFCRERSIAPSCSPWHVPAGLAPEVLAGGRASAASDVFSWGVVMWEVSWFYLFFVCEPDGIASRGGG